MSIAVTPDVRDHRPRVVVIGAGFAGINAAHALRNAAVEVTLIDKNNFHTFQPLLYQVSTAYLAPEEVSDTVRSIFRSQSNVNVIVGEVVGADWDNRRVELDDGTSVDFDYLVVGGGGTTNYFGIAGMDEHSWPLYTLADAVRLRVHLLSELERAASSTDHDPSRSTVVVVGGGPTGVEMAGALSTMGPVFIGEGVGLRVILVEALPGLLSNFSKKSGERALNDLRRRGVEVRLDTKVASADAEAVELVGGERIKTHTVVWGAGIRASSLGEKLGFDVAKNGAIIVGPDLQVPNRPGVFAAGDIASAVSKGQPVPALAPAAIQGGKHVARQIQRLMDGQSTKPFSYRDKGIMAVIGRGNAVAEIPFPFRIRLGGRAAWLMWLGVHIVYLIGFRNRIKVLVDWAWSYLTSKGSGAILVTGVESPPDSPTQDSKKAAS